MKFKRFIIKAKHGDKMILTQKKNQIFDFLITNGFIIINERIGINSLKIELFAKPILYQQLKKKFKKVFGHELKIKARFWVF